MEETLEEKMEETFEEKKEETFEEKKRRDCIERFGATKGNRLADEFEGKRERREESE